MRTSTHLFFAILLMFVLTPISVSAQKQPAGIRVEVSEAETDKTQYSIFTYKDTDSDDSFGYYLALGRVTPILGAIRDDITDMSFDDIRETCICLGSTSDEAFATLDAILALYGKDEGTTAEFQGRAATGGERLGAPNTTTCVVKKKLLGGKRLLFIFTSGRWQVGAYLSKSTVKELRLGLKIDKKLHPKQHR